MGLGSFVGTAMAAGMPQRRVASAASLGEKLRHAGVALVTAELGRMPAGPVWVLTVKGLNGQLVTVNVRVREGQDPHSADVADDVARRVTEYISRRAG